MTNKTTMTNAREDKTSADDIFLATSHKRLKEIVDY